MLVSQMVSISKNDFVNSSTLARELHGVIDAIQTSAFVQMYLLVTAVASEFRESSSIDLA